MVGDALSASHMEYRRNQADLRGAQREVFFYSTKGSIANHCPVRSVLEGQKLKKASYCFTHDSD